MKVPADRKAEIIAKHRENFVSAAEKKHFGLYVLNSETLTHIFGIRTCMCMSNLLQYVFCSVVFGLQ